MADRAELRREQDRLLRQVERWWSMEVTGWTVLGFSALPAVFIFVGWRSESSFWFWCTVVLGFAGLLLTGFSANRRLQAGAELEDIDDELRRLSDRDSAADEREAA